MPNFTEIKPVELLFPDLDNELATTRKFLALVPDGQNEWRPDPKSYTLGTLATHLVDLVGFGVAILTTTEMDFAKTPWVNRTIATTEERLREFDASAGTLSKGLKGATWEQLDTTWTLRAGEQVFVADARRSLLRSFYLSHSGHHRAQLGVYLRLLGHKIPGAYGPSADET